MKAVLTLDAAQHNDVGADALRGEASRVPSPRNKTRGSARLIVKPLSGQTDNQTSFYGPRSCRIFDVECCQRR